MPDSPPRKPMILAVDHGTSGIKAALVTAEGRIMDTQFAATPTIFLPYGGVEQDPEAWWAALVRCCRLLLKRNPRMRNAVLAMSVSSTFSSTVAVDETGRHLANCLTWMDGRGSVYVRRLMQGTPAVMGYGLGKIARWVPTTGGGPSLSGKDDLGHVLYWKNEQPDLYRRAFKFLPSKDYLNCRLTGRMAASFDSMTLFWVTDTRDVHDIRYSEKLLELTGIERDKLPELSPSTAVLGPLSTDASRELGLAPSVKVVVGSPDHQCAGIGSGCIVDFDAHLYVGTSSWIQCTVPFRKTDVLHSIASLPTAIPGRYYCANEQDMAGGCLEFLARMLGQAMDDDVETAYRQMDVLASRTPAGSGGVMFAPWLNGERTPVDDPHLRGMFVNLSAGTTREQMIRSVYEGVALNTRWSLGHVETFLRRTLDPITIVGGGAQSDFWCQLFADVLGRTMRRPVAPKQANARGAAFIAAVGLGLLDFKDIPALIEFDARFEPCRQNTQLYDRLFVAFRALHKANRSFLPTIQRIFGGR